MLSRTVGRINNSVISCGTSVRRKFDEEGYVIAALGAPVAQEMKGVREGRRSRPHDSFPSP